MASFHARRAVSSIARVQSPRPVHTLSYRVPALQKQSYNWRSFSGSGSPGSEVADYDVELARKMLVEEKGVLLDVRTPEVKMESKKCLGPCRISHLVFFTFA